MNSGAQVRAVVVPGLFHLGVIDEGNGKMDHGMLHVMDLAILVILHRLSPDGDDPASHLSFQVGS